MGMAGECVAASVGLKHAVHKGHNLLALLHCFFGGHLKGWSSWIRFRLMHINSIMDGGHLVLPNGWKTAFLKFGRSHIPVACFQCHLDACSFHPHFRALLPTKWFVVKLQVKSIIVALTLVEKLLV